MPSRLPPMGALIAVAGGCGIGVGVMALFLIKERDKLTNQAAFIKGAVQLLKEQPITKDLLGEELKIGKATLGDGWSRADKLHVQVRVPVAGEHDKAFLYAYARRKDEDEKLRLYKLEATFSKVSDKKLVLMDRTNEDDSDGADLIKLAIERAKAEAEERKRKEEEEAAAKAKELESPWNKRRQFVEQMKSWQPTR